MAENNDTKDIAPFAITIGRQFGSGGRELGKKLAERLGIDYYDKELLVESAKLAGVNPEFFEKKDERFPTFLNGLFSFSMGFSPMAYYTGASSISDDGLYKALSDFLLSTIEKKSFVVVGRSADYILRRHPRCINIFVHAPIEKCVDRITRRSDSPDRDKARVLAEKTNRLRAEYYNFYTDKTWGDAATYHLTIDSSTLPMDDIADIVIGYVKKKLNAK